MDAGWKETDDTEVPDVSEKPNDPENPDNGAIGMLVSTPLKNLMLLMFVMKMENLLQFLN